LHEPCVMWYLRPLACLYDLLQVDFGQRKGLERRGEGPEGRGVCERVGVRLEVARLEVEMLVLELKGVEVQVVVDGVLGVEADAVSPPLTSSSGFCGVDAPCHTGGSCVLIDEMFRECESMGVSMLAWMR